MANIFISYRRADSRAMTDNIHNHLANQLGKAHVFQDVEDIPPGVNFVTYLEQTISSMDVLLVVIGQKWLSITGEDGQRRLDAPDDPVRLEVATALRNPKLLVIPLLVDDAPMPRQSDLPEDLRELHFRNAARVRYNPDFERDMQDLLTKIGQQVKLRPDTGRRVSWVMVLPILIGVLVVGVAVFNRPVSAPPTPTPTPAPTFEPPAPGEYSVLIGNLEPLTSDTPTRPVTRAIADDLRVRLEQDIPFSTLRVREYGRPIASDEEAQAAAQAAGASIVVWGDYSDSLIDVRVQIGVVDAFPTLGEAGIPLETLKRLANMRVRLTDEREQSVAAQIFGIATLLYAVESDGYSYLTSLAALDLLKDTPTGEMTGGVAPRVHAGLLAYVSNPTQALDEFNAALELETNALLYTLRGYAAQRLGSYDDGLADARTALSLAPEWGMPIFILGNNGTLFGGSPDEAADIYTTLIEKRPDDWFPLTNRAFAYYLAQDYDRAVIDIERVINDFQPKANIPYGLAVAIYLREGKTDGLKAIKDTVVREFPTPTFFNRILNAQYGENTPASKFGHGLSAIAYMALGQFRSTISEADAALTFDANWADIYVLKGLAYCNLDDLEAAEAAYSRAIELDPEIYIAYLMRAQARNLLGNPLGAGQDVLHVQGTAWGQRTEIQSLITAGLSMEITCKTFFE